MKMKVVGMDPDLAANYAVHLVDQTTTDEERVKVLLNNTTVPVGSLNPVPKVLASGKSIDLFVGELLGLAMVGIFYNWAGKSAGHTYQVVVGVEDGQKANVENVLSDGGIWDNQNKQKMLFQQVATQGYYPKETRIDAAMIANIISKKVAVRNNYPNNCGLIVNVYGNEGDVDYRKVAEQCDLSAYTIVLINIYDMPDLKEAATIHLDPERLANNIPPESLTVNLERHPVTDGDWAYSFDGETA